MKDIENSKKESPVKEAPFLGLTGMGGGVNSLMWAGAAQPKFDLYAFGLNTSSWPATPSNNEGALGLNNAGSDFKNSPVQVPGDWYKLYTGGVNGNFGMTVGGAKDEIGTLWMWGSNAYGNLTQNGGPANKRSSPTQIPGTDWANASISRFSLAVKDDGTAWSWGCNQYGELGHNNKTQYSSPKQIGGTGWSTDPFTLVASAPGAGQSSFAIKANGTLFAWGQNSGGQMAQNGPANTHYSSPKQIGTNTNWKSLMNGSSTMGGAIKTDGTLWMWGWGNGGGLAQNNRTKYSSPVQVPGTWKQAACGGYPGGTFGIKTDGTLWSWGYNFEGSLGHNNQNKYSSPVQVGTRTDWGYIDSGQGDGASVKGITTDGVLWVWGKNYDEYTLGVGPGKNSGAFSSPTQVANITTNWGTGSAYDTDYAWTIAGVWGAGFCLRQR